MSSFFYFFIFSVFCFVQLQAKPRNRLDTNQKVDALENSVTTITQTTPVDTITIQTASADLVSTPTPTTLSAAAILYKPNIQQSAFALTNNKESSSLPIYGNIYEASLKWDWGVKLLAAQSFNEQNFTMSAEFTYFRTNGNRAISQPLLTSVIPLKGTFTDHIYYGRSEVDFKFYNLDVGLSRDYFTSKTLSVKPFIGLKSTWNDIDEVTFYSHDSLVHQKYSSIEEKSKVWGMGPLGAITTKWYFCDNVIFFGKLATSSLYSYKRAFQIDEIPSDPGLSFSVFQKYHEFVPYMELDLGFTLYRLLNQGKQCLQFTLAYESQYYWGLRRTFSLESFNSVYRSNPISSNVSLYGVSGTVSIVF